MTAPKRAAAKPPDDQSDGSLLAGYRDGSQDAASQLYARYAQRLRSLVREQCSTDLARRVETDDIVQSVFRIFFQAVRQGLYDVPDGDDLWKLLLVIALNKIRAQGIFHHAAKRDIRRTTPIEGPAGPLESPARQDDGEQVFYQMVIAEALAQLTPAHRSMVELRMEGYEVTEIATRTSRSKRTVERLLQEARKRLNTLLQHEE